MLSLLGGAVDAAYHVVSAFAQVLAPVAGGLAPAAAIVAFTMAVRLLLLPLSYYATRGLASQAALAPQIQALQKRHAGQPDRLQREVAALYQREGVGRFAGCLPALLQLPLQRGSPAIPSTAARSRGRRRTAPRPAGPPGSRSGR